MSIVDLVLGALIIFGAIHGYREGFIMSLFSLLGILLGVLGGFKLMGLGMSFLAREFNVDTAILPYISFGVVFIIIVVLVSIIGRMFQASIDKNFLGRVDQAVAALLGLTKTVFMCSVMIWIVNSLQIEIHEQWIHDSWLYPKVAVAAPRFTDYLGGFVPMFENIF